ncbi:MAG: hypothetical protein R3F11_29170 [Verrucomicrobiales bacterium]
MVADGLDLAVQAGDRLGADPGVAQRERTGDLMRLGLEIPDVAVLAVEGEAAIFSPGEAVEPCRERTWTPQCLFSAGQGLGGDTLCRRDDLRLG